MNRYFLELGYLGTRYSGFQVQDNANSIQAEVEKALQTIFRQEIRLTGSSRTDAGVHARQNYFHFDFDKEVKDTLVYNLNALLPDDIVVHAIILPGTGLKGEPAHCRFDAISREYRYHIYRNKDPFLKDRAYYYPYRVDKELMDAVARAIMQHEDFTSFSKRNTQVKSFICKIELSEWREENGGLVYQVRANRFLRGMVRAMVATMLQVGRGKMSLHEFNEVIEKRDCTLADFSVPAHGLILERVNYPENFLPLKAVLDGHFRKS